MKAQSMLALRIVCLTLSLLFFLSACGNLRVENEQPSLSESQPTTTVQQHTTAQKHATATAQSTTKGYSVKVFFSKRPQSEEDFTQVFPIQRTSPDEGVATFALEQLIKGPTASEEKDGYYSEVRNALNGPSSCSNDADFTLALDKNNNQAEKGTATLTFCRQILSPGVGTDARIKAEIEATLRQFSTIQKVIILNQEGHCVGDASGLDHCLR